MPERRSASDGEERGAEDASDGSLRSSLAVADVLKASSAIELTGEV
jgi:hypothetical protein